MKTIDQFKPNCKVNHHHMSPVASKHSNLAVAGLTGELDKNLSKNNVKLLFTIFK